MASLLAHLNPTPKFPDYSGPYKVGTVDLEIPSSDLPQHVPAPDPNIPTIQFRVFYPCEVTSKQHKHPKWLPDPQHEYVGAFMRFLGVGGKMADFISYFPRVFYYITVPAHHNAPPLPPPTNLKRWPVMMFSHGLGGTRLTYSHIVGSIASHGVVVVAPEHRDGSAPISFVNHPGQVTKAAEDPEKPSARNITGQHTVDYKYLPHTPSKEVEDGRNQQLRIRLWEQSTIYEALLRLDAGKRITHVSSEPRPASESALHNVLQGFQNRLDVHTPGAMSWAGHSFGAATTVQFVKSVFYRPTAANQDDPHFSSYSPLFTPAPSSSLSKQITPNSPVLLLDLWALPVRSQSTRWLFDRPLPCYSADGPGGTRVLAILSEAFFKWNGNLLDTKRIVSEHPSLDGAQPTKPTARIFYPKTSAHLSQSDFGVLWPWLTRKVFHAEDPERTLKLNVRAVLQVMRNAKIPVADTSTDDIGALTVDTAMKMGDQEGLGDWQILTTDGSVDGWVAVNPSVLANEHERTEKNMDKTKAPSDAVIDEEVMDGNEQRTAAGEKV